MPQAFTPAGVLAPKLGFVAMLVLAVAAVFIARWRMASPSAARTGCR
jgi:hypothetical protein